MKILTGASLAMAVLQSLCTAVLTISGIRVAIGLTALAAASGFMHRPGDFIRTRSASPCWRWRQQVRL
jgi:hypothetical protein